MVVRFASFELDFRRFVIQRDGRRVPIRPKVFDLLAHLVRHRDRVVTREELFEVLWGETRVAKGSLSGLVNELRQALGERGHASSSIRTLHARGYQFVAPVEIEDETDGPSRREERWSGAEDVLDHLRHALGRALRGGGRVLCVEGGTSAARRSLVRRALVLAKALGFATLRLDPPRRASTEDRDEAPRLLALARQRPLLVTTPGDVTPGGPVDPLVRALVEKDCRDVPLIVLVVAERLSEGLANVLEGTPPDSRPVVRLRLAESERALVDRWMRARGIDPLPAVLADALVEHLSGHASAIDVVLGGLAAEAARRAEPGLEAIRDGGGGVLRTSPMRRVRPSSEVAGEAGDAKGAAWDSSAREAPRSGATAGPTYPRSDGRFGASGE